MKDEIQTSFYLTDEFIIELIFDNYLQPEIQFAMFDKMTGEVTYHPELKLENGQILKPLDLDIIKEGKILLPSSAEKYTNEGVLVQEIKTFVNKYLDLPHPFYYELVSHYVLMTWVYDRLSVVPYLRSIGDYGSGKTRFVQAIGSICYKPLFLAGATSDAFIFRMIELFKGTMVINELERINSDLQSQITVILNCGFEKGLSVGRVEGDRQRVPKLFDVFSPKIISSRKKFKDSALESRIISIPMKPTKRIDIPTLLNESFWYEAQKLRDKLLMFRFKNFFVLDFDNKEKKLVGIEPRLKQTLLPLFYVIQDPEIEKEFIDYALEFQQHIFSERSFESDTLIAEKTIELLNNNEKVTVGDVKEKINTELEEKEKFSSKAVGQKIREFGFKTKKVQGVYQVVYDQQIINYLSDRYHFLSDGKESLPSPPSPPDSSSSQPDLVDKVDFKEG